jgi:sortase A
VDAASVIGRIEIPQISLSVPMTAGITTEGLLRGAGHVPGTAFPGGLGTMGIAGHRDTFFRPLRYIQRGMKIRVSDKSGAYDYQVDSTEVVSPERVEVLNIGSRPELALVTCYPFHYIGAAPRRFIVHAHLLSVAPAAD